MFCQRGSMWEELLVERLVVLVSNKHFDYKLFLITQRERRSSVTFDRKYKFRFWKTVVWIKIRLNKGS